MREAVIVNALRTAIGKAPRGSLKDARPDDLGAAVVKELMARTPEVSANEVEDVVRVEAGSEASPADDHPPGERPRMAARVRGRLL